MASATVASIWAVRSALSSRRHRWVALPDSIQRHAPELWEPVRPLYDAGKYAEAADRGRELIEARPTRRTSSSTWRAARASRAGLADAVEHLGRAIAMREGCRGMAKADSDFDPIRSEPAFADLVGG